MSYRRAWISPEEAERFIHEGAGHGVKIAVLDSGIETAHPKLAGLNLCDDLAVLDNGVTLETVSGEGHDVFGHGTAIAGIIHEIAPHAQIGSIRVLGGQLDSRTAIIREGARLAIERGYHILNCSFGCGLMEHVLQYKSWVDEAYLRGIHVVAACNNFDFAKTEWPAYFPSVISVNMGGAVDDPLFYYNPGHLVEFVARGVNVPVAWKDRQTKEVSGSSFAAARVTGLLARLLSEQSGLEPLQVKALFHRIARPWNGACAKTPLSYGV